MLQIVIVSFPSAEVELLRVKTLFMKYVTDQVQVVYVNDINPCGVVVVRLPASTIVGGAVLETIMGQLVDTYGGKFTWSLAWSPLEFNANL